QHGTTRRTRRVYSLGGPPAAREPSPGVATSGGDPLARVDDAAATDERDLVLRPVPTDLGPAADAGTLVDHAAHHPGAGPHPHVVEQHGVDHLGTGCHLHPG